MTTYPTRRSGSIELKQVVTLNVGYEDSRGQLPSEVDETNEPLLLATSERSDQKIDEWALACLLLQHASKYVFKDHESYIPLISNSTFNAAAYDFAIFLFRSSDILCFKPLADQGIVIEVFRDTLIPASLVGLFSKSAGLLFSGYIGGLVDRVPRLTFVRWAISLEKSFHALNYALFLILFSPLRQLASTAFHLQGQIGAIVSTWTILSLTIFFSSFIGLANTALTVAVERDWYISLYWSRP